MLKEIVLPQCGLCGERKRGNFEMIQRGLLLKGIFVCWDCNSAVSNLSASSLDYDFYKERIKHILY